MHTPDALVFHIGTHKTGTSTIQASLAASYPDLLKRGILYPQTGRVRERPQHANIAWGVLGHPDHQAELGGTEELLEEIRAVGPRAVVLSTEVFTLAPTKPTLAEWARQLCDVLGVGELQVLGYVRPQWEFLESSYASRVRRGKEGDSFPAYVERLIGQRVLDYPTRFGHWRHAFGDRLTLRPYDSDRFPGRDVRRDFWRAVERLPDRPVRSVKSRNLRPGERLVGMLRLLRQKLADQEFDRITPLEPVLAQARRTLERALPNDPPFRGLTPELLTRIHGRFEESNRRFIEEYGDAHAHLVEAPDTAVRRPPWTIDDASEGERQLFADVLGQAIATCRTAGEQAGRHPPPYRQPRGG